MPFWMVPFHFEVITAFMRLGKAAKVNRAALAGRYQTVVDENVFAVVASKTALVVNGVPPTSVTPV